MAKRKVNIVALLILIGTVVLVVGGVFLLHKFQVKRTAANQLRAAEVAIDQGDDQTAINSLNKYLHFYPKNAEAQLTYAELLAKRANENPSDLKLQERAYGAQDVARRLTENRTNKNLLRNLAVFSKRLKRYGDAVNYFKELANDYPNDYDMLMELGDSYAFQSFYQPALSVFQDIIRKDHSYFPAYIRIAEIQADKLNSMMEAEAVLEQMVTLNKDAAEAFALKARFFAVHDKLDKADSDIQRASLLAEDNQEVLATATEMAIKKKDFDQADKLLANYMTLYPNDVRIIDFRSNLELARNNPEEAERIALDTLSKDESPMAKIKLIEIQIKAGKYDEASERLQALRDDNFPAFVINFYEGHIALMRKNWRLAAERLEQAKLEMQMFPEMQAQANIFLGTAYEQLQQYDRQLDSFSKALSELPKSVRAHTGVAMALFRLGRKEEAREALVRVKNLIGEKAFFEDTRLKAVFLQLEIARQQQLPPEQRTGEILEILQKEKIDPDKEDPIGVLTQAELLVKQKQYDQAQEILMDACKKSPKQPSYWSAMAQLALIKGDNVGAANIIVEAKKNIEFSPALITVELKLYLAEGVDTAKAKVDKMTEQLMNLPTDRLILALKPVSEVYIILKEYDKAQTILKRQFELEPTNVTHLIKRFQLARAVDNEQVMNEIIESVMTRFGVKSGDYDYLQASKLVWNVRKKRSEMKMLNQARDMLRNVYSVRPNWSEIPLLRLEIALMENSADDAINALFRLRELSGLTTAQNTQLIQFLYRAGRYEEAKQVIDTMGDIRDDNIRRIQAGMEAESGNYDSALEIARTTAKGSSNAIDLLWYGQIALKAGKAEEAEEAIRKSISIDPQNIEATLALISILKDKNETNEIQQIILDMDKHFEGETLALGKAEGARLLGDAPMTFKNYVDALNKYPDNLTLLYAMSQFLLQTTRPDKAMPYLQAIMNKNEKNPDPNKTRLHWARRNYVRLLLTINNNMDNQEEAMRLLDINMGESDQPAIEDVKMKAIILVSRNNPRDRAKAVKLIEGLLQRRVTLEPEEQFILARLYNEAELWDKARAQMIDLLVREPNNIRYQTEFIRMMFRRNRAATEIQPRIVTLEKQFPNELIPVLLRSELLHVQEKDSIAGDMLMERFRSTKDDQGTELLTIARQMDRIGQVEKAEEAYKRIARTLTGGTLEYVRFLGRRGRLDEAFNQLEMLKDSEEYKLADILDTLVDVVRICPSQPTPSQYARAEAILQQRLQENPDDLAIQIQLAEYRMLEGRAEEAEQIYDKIISTGNLSDKEKIVFYNNMAYTLAVTKRNPQKALDLINEAIRIQGPMEYLLDTRALANLAFNDRDPVKIQQAISDLEHAVAKNPTALYYFHLARAYQAFADREMSKATMDICRNQYEMTIQDVPKLERSEYGNMLQNL